jgi:hypothetical protein
MKVVTPIPIPVEVQADFEALDILPAPKFCPTIVEAAIDIP